MGRAPFRVAVLTWFATKVGKRGKYHRSGFRVPLVQLNAPNLDSGFQRVPTLNPCKVVDFGEGVADAGAYLVVIQSGKAGNRDCVGYSRLIDVESVGGAAVITELELVHEGWGKNMQQFDGAIHRSGGELLAVQEIIGGIGLRQRLRIHRSIEVEPEECSSTGREMLVEADHGGVFKDALPAFTREFIDTGSLNGIWPCG